VIIRITVYDPRSRKVIKCAVRSHVIIRITVYDPRSRKVITLANNC